MSQLTTFLGIPASGKSTLVQDLYSDVVICPDEIRRELTGDRADQSRNEKVFEIAFVRLHDYFQADKDVIWDATNLTARARAGLLTAASTYDVETRLLVMRTSFEECKARNLHRVQFQVPAHVMDKMHAQFIRSLSEIGYEAWSQIVNVWEDGSGY